MFRFLLSHPLARNLDIDSPAATIVRYQIIQDKPFLKKIYREWYISLLSTLPNLDEPILELGSGAGFLKSLLPDTITSDVFHLPHIDAVIDGQSLPIGNASLRAILMTNVLHHLPQPKAFLSEAARCIRTDGIVAMIEPWVSYWSSFVFKFLHHEPFLPEAREWTVPQSGPLSGANGAMPWIIFGRDRTKFEIEFPEWQVEEICPIMPFRYLVSGGVSLRGLMPGWTFGAWRWIEGCLNKSIDTFAMFARIVLVRTDHYPN
jgi:SAM-dependent methyltransferase